MRSILLLIATLLVGCPGPAAGPDVPESSEDVQESSDLGQDEPDVGLPDTAPEPPDVPDPELPESPDLQESEEIAVDPEDVSTPDADGAAAPEVEEPDVVEPDTEQPDIAAPDGIAPDAADVIESEDIQDVADTDPQTDVDPPDVEDDTAEVVEECLPSDPPPQGALDLNLGQFKSGEFVPLLDGDAIEIVQGPQGGVHLEIRLKVTLPAWGEPKALARISSQSFQPCCGPNEGHVGDFLSNKYPLYPEEPGGEAFASGDLPIIFKEDLGSVYANDECCVRVFVEVLAPGSNEVVQSGWRHVALDCVDFF